MATPTRTDESPVLRPITSDDPESRSAAIVVENVEQLRALFPEAFTEYGIDFDVLKQLLGGAVVEGDEKYGLNWHGKRQARQFALTPSTGTLLPRRDESVDWDATKNFMIEGENLEVLKLLQKSYAGKVKMIYIDPPYNTGSDFVYEDDYRDSLGNYLALTAQIDEEGRRVGSNTEASGRFHTKWLNMMWPRLKLARALLSDQGVLFVSINDDELATLRAVCDEIFGDENRLAILIWNKQHSQQQGLFKTYHEYVLVYAKQADAIANIAGGAGTIDAGALKKISRANPASNFTFPAGVRFEAPEGTELRGTYGDSEQVTVVQGRLICKDGKTAEPVTLSAGWTQKNQMKAWFAGQEVVDTKGQRVVEFYFNSTGKLKCLKERSSITPPSLLPEYGMVSEQTDYLAELLGASVFNNPKPVAMIADFIRWFVGPREIVLDFFAGSGTTGEAVWRVNQEDNGDRRFILVQLPEPVDPQNPDQSAAARFLDTIHKPHTIAEITKERLRRAADRIQAEGDESGYGAGFRVCALAESNIRSWQPERDDLATALLGNVEHMLGHRSEQDLVFELLLKQGLDLATQVDQRTIAGSCVHSLGAGVLFACLAERIDSRDVESLAAGISKWRRVLAPVGDSQIVVRDSAFADDVAKANFVAMLQQHGLENVRSL